ncbi:MarR family winged helix-turn-helix transcriptional regulator [Paenibacillus sp. TH7-28]
MVKKEELFEVTSMFRTLLKSISQEWNKRGREYNLSFPQYKMLYILDMSGTQKVSQLAECLGITPAAITGITDKLLTEGYVKRERAEIDRRVVNISITELGKDIIRQVNENQKEMIDGIFNQLREEDLQHLRRIFALLLASLEQTKN